MPEAPLPFPASSAPRRPTGKPGVYLIPEAQLPPGFAERVERPPSPAPTPRPAATVVLLRPAEHTGRPEALLLRRPTRSRFAADAWVFPGGAVDDADREALLARHATGPAPAAWARRLALENPAEAFGYVVAALREAWEETGLLLAEGGCPDALSAAREALITGEHTFAEVVERETIRLQTDGLLYLAHWITPEPEPRRYDTRFFAARVSEGAECVLLGEELVEAAWLTPAEALERFHAGDMKLLPPTVDTLARLAPYTDLDALWAALAEAPVPAILPRMRRAAGGVEIVVGG
jgi:8-oxo-dGTP pyrophosphatase MutT (NUDIX family)